MDDALPGRLETPWDKPAAVFRDIVDAIHNTYEIRLDATGVAEGTRALVIRTRVSDIRVHAPASLTITAAAVR